MKRRIKKKQSLRYDVEELRDYVSGKERMYPHWRLERLRAICRPTGKRLSRLRAARMIKTRDQEEHAAMREMVKSLVVVDNLCFRGEIRRPSSPPLKDWGFWTTK